MGGSQPDTRTDSEPSSSSARLVAFLGRQPRWRITALGIALLGGLWVIDRTTAPDVSFLVFYLAPVLLLTWFVGRRAGMFMSLASAVLWFLDDVLTTPAFSRSLTPYWNAMVKLGFFLLVVHILTSLKAALERQRQAERERMELELAMAEQVQKGLFPQKLRPIAGLDYFGICRPAAAVGGDYYDFIPLGTDRLGIAVGDISGKGLPAALLMASLQGSLRSWASSSPADEVGTIEHVNRHLCSLTGSSQFATLFWGVYDASRRELAYVNAGHNRPMLLRRVDGFNLTRQRLEVGGTVLGMFPDAVFQRGVVAMRPGDLLVLFSDGITEAPRADVEFGETRLETLLGENASLPPADLCERVLAEVRSYLGEQPTPDDLTIVALKVR